MNYYSESNPKTEMIMRKYDEITLIYRLIPCEIKNKSFYIILLTSIDGSNVTDAAVTYDGSNSDALLLLKQLSDYEITPISVLDIISDEKSRYKQNEKFSKKVYKSNPL